MAENLTSGISTFAIIVIVGIALFWLLSIYTDDQRNPSMVHPNVRRIVPTILGVVVLIGISVLASRML